MIRGTVTRLLRAYAQGRRDGQGPRPRKHVSQVPYRDRDRAEAWERGWWSARREVTVATDNAARHELLQRERSTVIRLRELGWTTRRIAVEVGLSKTSVLRILNGDERRRVEAQAKP
jgi:hypothetical protein